MLIRHSAILMLLIVFIIVFNVGIRIVILLLHALVIAEAQTGKCKTIGEHHDSA
jgi:hypothetical protein